MTRIQKHFKSKFRYKLFVSKTSKFEISSTNAFDVVENINPSSWKSSAASYTALTTIPDSWNKDTKSREQYIKSQKKAFDSTYSYTVIDGQKKVLGKGTFGTVYKAKSKVNNAEVAIKFPNGIKDEQTAIDAVDAARLEVALWKKLKGFPYILPLLDQFVIGTDHQPSLPALVTVTPCINGGTLHTLIKSRHPEALPDDEAWIISKQILLARKFVLFLFEFSA